MPPASPIERFNDSHGKKLLKTREFFFHSVASMS